MGHYFSTFSNEGGASQVNAFDNALVIHRDISTRGKLIQVLIFLMQFRNFVLCPFELFVLDFKLRLVNFQLVDEFQDIQG